MHGDLVNVGHKGVWETWERRHGPSTFLIASFWIARGKSRWYLFLVALVLAAAQIGVSFL